MNLFDVHNMRSRTAGRPVRVVLYAAILLLTSLSCAGSGNADGPVGQFNFQPPSGDGDGDAPDLMGEDDLDGSVEGDFSESAPDLDDENYSEGEDAAEDDENREGAGDGSDVADADESAEEILPDSFCRAFDDCRENEVCDFSLGRCEYRAVMPENFSAVTAIHPPAAAPGDFFVIDGTRFYGTGIAGFLSVKVSIGPMNFNTLSGQMLIDENRISLRLPQGAVGAILVTNDNGLVVRSSVDLAPSPVGVIPCVGATPAANGVRAAGPETVGPFAAGYLDLDGTDARLFYPADCGSLRRPGVPGEYPFFLILHGNGAGFINYEYLGQMLATWGFVSLMPSINMDMNYNPDVVAEIYDAEEQVRGKDLSSVHPALAGIRTTAAWAAVGHSRGTARMEWFAQDHPELAALMRAAIFLGPVDDGVTVPVGMFMDFGAAGDLQSNDLMWNSAYSRQAAPKWKIMIQGGNHSLFSDHKVWFGPMADMEPTISRAAQMKIVARFVLPFLMKSFGLSSEFESILAGPSTAAYTVESE